MDEVTCPSCFEAFRVVVPPLAELKMIREMQEIWDTDALQSEIDLSIARRLLIRQAHAQGTPPNWDYVAAQNNSGWCRAGADYSAWSLNVLNPR